MKQGMPWIGGAHLGLGGGEAGEALLPSLGVARLALLVQAVLGVSVPVEVRSRLRLAARPARMRVARRIGGYINRQSQTF